MKRTFTCTFEIYRYFRELSVLYYMLSLCCLYICFSPCNDFLFLCKDHYENKVVKPVLCHPCQYHLVNVNVYFIFHLFFSVCLFLLLFHFQLNVFLFWQNYTYFLLTLWVGSWFISNFRQDISNKKLTCCGHFEVERCQILEKLSKMTKLHIFSKYGPSAVWN